MSNQTAEERIERAESKAAHLRELVRICTQDHGDVQLLLESATQIADLLEALAADAKRAGEERDEAVKRAEKIEFTHKRRVIEAELRMKEERDQALERAAKAERERDEAKELRGAALDAMDVRKERDHYATLLLSMQQTWAALEKAVESKDPDAIAKATSDWAAARSAVLTAKVGG